MEDMGGDTKTKHAILKIWDLGNREYGTDQGQRVQGTLGLRHCTQGHKDIRDTKLRRQYMERHKTLDMEVQRHNIKMQDKRTLDIDRGQNKGHGDLVT